MNSKERYITALNMGKPDKVPMFDFLINKNIFRKTLSIEPKDWSLKQNYAASLVLGFDGIYLNYGTASSYKAKYIKEDVYLDEWGAAVKKDPASWPVDFTVQFVIENEDDLKQLKVPDPDRPERYEEIVEIIELNRDRIAIGGGVLGPVTQSWMLMNPEKIMWNLYDNPRLIKDMFTVVNDFNIAVGLNEIKAGVDHIWISEDIASTTNTYFSLKIFKEQVYPFLEKMIKEFRKVKKDLPIIFHCCGNFRLFIEDIISLGIQAIHPFQQVAGWDIKEVKENYGDRVCIITGVDQTRTLPNCTPKEVEKECKRILEIGKKNGGFIFGSDHSLHEGIPFENIWAMIKSVDKYGLY